MGVTTELNAQQLAAIRHAGGPACILAGAGTGKTTVITERFRWLAEHGVAPGRILVLTFSRQAADEMRTRITERLTVGYPGLSVGTFHSFCLERLTRLAADSGHAAPTVIADGGRQALLAPLLAQVAVRYYAGIRAREYLSDALVFIDRANDELVSPEGCRQFVAALRSGELGDPDGSGRPPAKERVDCLADLTAAYQLYHAELRRRGALDYGAMVARLVERWRADAAALTRARGSYDYILVDEFQDANGAQFELVRTLAAPDDRLMVVGDDDQAIYGFRGASDRFIRHFRDFYPGAAIYDLTENHRSHQRILDAANASIAAAHGAGDARRLTSPGRPGGPRPASAAFATQTDEAVWIADRIAAGLSEPGSADGEPARRPRDFAVLCRSADQLALPIVQALARRGIPARLSSGEPRRDPVVADALAALRIVVALAASQTPPEASLRRVLAAALPPAEFQTMTAALRARERSAADGLFAATVERSETAAQLAGALAELAGRAPAEQVYGAVRLASRWAGSAGPAAWPRLRELATAADAWLRTGSALGEFIAGYTPPDVDLAGADAVAVMTVHSAKGLQFPVVFVAGLAAGVFPVTTRLAPVFDFAPLGAWLGGADYQPRTEGERQAAQLLEERRLFYVAMTRAKDQLWLSGAGTYGTLACEESPFIGELDAAGVIDRLPDAAAAQSAADIVSKSRAVLLDLAERRLVAIAPGVVLKRGLDARSALAAGAGATDLVARDDARPYRPGQGLRTSVSALETYDRCPRQFFFEQCLKLPSEAALPMSFGNALHATLAAFNRQRAVSGTIPPEADLLGWWQARLDADVFSSRRQYRQFLRRGETYLCRYRLWEEQQDKALPGRRIEAVEQEFRFAYADADGAEHDFRGRFDLIVRHPDGALEIIDYKSGKRSVNKQPRQDSPNNPDRSWQLAVYHLALSAERAIESATPPAIHTTYCFLAHPGDDFGLPVETFNERGENVITCHHNDETLAVVRAELDATLRRIRANEFPAEPRDQRACEWCQFTQLCEVSKHDYR